MVLRKNFSIWFGLGVLAFYYIGYTLFGPVDSKKVMDALVIGAAVTITITWSRAAVSAIRQGMRDGTSNILAGLWILWTVLLLYFVWVVVFTTAGRPEAWRLSPISGTFSSLFFVAGAFTILAPINIPRVELNRPTFMRWLIGVGVGMFVAGALVSALLTGALDYGR